MGYRRSLDRLGCLLRLASRKDGTRREEGCHCSWIEGLGGQGGARRGRPDAVGEGDVNDIDKERWRKEGNSIIVIVGVGKEVRMAREGVRAGKDFAWDMDRFQVEVREVDKPTGLSSVEVLGGTEVGEVLMVGEDLDWEGGSVEVVLP